jgi:hypothetical protein
MADVQESWWKGIDYRICIKLANHALHTDRTAHWTHGGSGMVRLIQSLRHFRHPRGG